MRKETEVNTLELNTFDGGGLRFSIGTHCYLTYLLSNFEIALFG